MLVTRRGGLLLLVTQPDHAALAGQLVRQWGNGEFAMPVPRDALICAATHHDDGWFELDGGPAYNPQARRPAHFTELALSDTVGPYGRGVESVYERDSHAGALVSMHFSGFYTSRWGVGGGGPSEDPIARQVVAAQELRWMPALRDAWSYRGRRSEFDAHTWHAYEVLQAVDLLSLALGLTDLELPAADGAPQDAGATLARVDQTPGPRLVTAVPLRAGGPYVTIRLEVVGPRRVVLEPYPLRAPEVELAIVFHELEDRAYASAEEAAQAFHSGPLRELSITIAGPAS